MIVVDGRTDAEKLTELMAAGSEETNLDFKSTLDLSRRSSRDSLLFVKDVVSMINLPTGGYLVIGVDDRGRPAHDQAAVDVARFDSADLRAMVARYVEAPVHLIAQPHRVEDRDVVLVFARPNPDGLPIPFSSIGQYERDGRMETVFREGDVVVREGTSNVPLRYAHWDTLLGSYRDRLRAETRADAEALIALVVDALGQVPAEHSGTVGGAAARSGPLPLLLGMGWSAFESALVTHLETEPTVRLRKFLSTAISAIEDGAGHESAPDRDSAYAEALDALAVIAADSARCRRDDVFVLAVDVLRRAYDAGGRARTDVGEPGSDTASSRHWMEVLQRVFAIGRVLIAEQRWDLLPRLVHREVPVSDTYVYESWLRHGQVAASRTQLLPNDRGGSMLSAARLAIAERPWLHPDVTTPSEFRVDGQLDPHDVLLNQLVQFDLWWCVMAASRRTGRTGRAFYPSCSAFRQQRAQPAIDLIASSSDARTAAFPDASDHLIADALAIVVDAATRESFNHGGFWSGVGDSSKAGRFLVENDVPLERSDW